MRRGKGDEEGEDNVLIRAPPSLASSHGLSRLYLTINDATALEFSSRFRSTPSRRRSRIRGNVRNCVEVEV